MGGNPRQVYLKSFNAITFAVENTISTLTISNLSNAYISNDNVLAYYPNTTSYSGGNTAFLFINLIAAFPCNSAAIVCNLFTYEEENFQFGKPFIQASDSGNHFTMFRNPNAMGTYGFGVMGCATFDPNCVTDFEVSLVCLLPPGHNQC